ncbi:hypothetical protein M2408_005290 [Sphingobacterium sp. BIGb0165]|nr:hypothetical protein [Sphingobacterium sp. BIGb0165]
MNNPYDKILNQSYETNYYPDFNWPAGLVKL